MTRPCDGPGTCREAWVQDANGDWDLVGVKTNMTVPDGCEGSAYCSITCAVMAGEMKVRQQEGKDAQPDS
jgi:ribosomal protein S26